MTFQLALLAEAHRVPVIDILNHYIDHGFAAHPDPRVGYDFYDLFLGAIKAGYPGLAVMGPSGEVAGWGFLRAWHFAASFRRTAEISYFLWPQHTRRGLGEMLLTELSARGRAMGVDTLLASVNSFNPPSLAFHAKHGFVECGRFVRVGRKLGLDFDVICDAARHLRDACRARGWASRQLRQPAARTARAAGR